jgi:hypothetical protein
MHNALSEDADPTVIDLQDHVASGRRVGHQLCTLQRARCNEDRARNAWLLLAAGCTSKACIVSILSTTRPFDPARLGCVDGQSAVYLEGCERQLLNQSPHNSLCIET